MKRIFVKLAVALIVTVGFAQSSLAYIVAVPSSQASLNFNQPVRILLSGRGTDLGDQPLKSAFGRALLYKRNFAQDQLVLISVIETTIDTEAQLRAAGWNVITKNNTKLETNSATAEIVKFAKIRSLEFFGHNSPELGTQSDGLGFRFDFRQRIVRTIGSHFTRGAYAIIHGCNSGWIIAQNLSRVWNIAVAGSFTGTRFERLHSDGHFYVDQEGKAPNNQWARRNEDLGVSCSVGGCLRMRPSTKPYNGKWGSFEGPVLSHYKFFCQLSEAECEKTMATSLYGSLSEKSLRTNSTFAEFKEVAQQWLCPSTSNRQMTNACIAELIKIEAGSGNRNAFFTTRGSQLSCTLQSCAAQMTCSDSEHKCQVTGQVSRNSTTLADEYMRFLNGFRAIERDGF